MLNTFRNFCIIEETELEVQEDISGLDRPHIDVLQDRVLGGADRTVKVVDRVKEENHVQDPGRQVLIPVHPGADVAEVEVENLE